MLFDDSSRVKSDCRAKGNFLEPPATTDNERAQTREVSHFVHREKAALVTNPASPFRADILIANAFSHGSGSQG
jgi:hypothetical protein